MKGNAVILFLLLSSFAFGQIKEPDLLKKEHIDSIVGLISVDTLSREDIAGIYSGGLDDGEWIISGIWRITLHTDRTVKSSNCGCHGACHTDNGFWSVNKNKLLLRLEKSIITLSILKSSNFYFFIPDQKLEKFMRDLHSLQEVAEKVKPLVFDEYMMAHCLTGSYFSKEIKLIPGHGVVTTDGRQ